MITFGSGLTPCSLSQRGQQPPTAAGSRAGEGREEGRAAGGRRDARSAREGAREGGAGGTRGERSAGHTGCSCSAASSMIIRSASAWPTWQGDGGESVGGEGG